MALRPVADFFCSAFHSHTLHLRCDRHCQTSWVWLDQDPRLMSGIQTPVLFQLGQLGSSHGMIASQQ